MRRRSEWVVTGALLVGSSACEGPPRLSAEKMGDLTYVLAERMRPDVEHVAHCGSGALTDMGRQVLRRTPYLQRVDTDSAWVMFTAGVGKAVTVDVTRPDGDVVDSVSAALDTSARTAAGTWQGVARVQGLQPDTLYCYALRGMTARAGFRTAPSGGGARPVRFIAFGDSGDGSVYQYTVARQMLTTPFDFMLHTGDVAYDDGTWAQLEKGFFEVYADTIRSFPAFLVAGNHDYATEDGAPFRQVFALPDNATGKGVERWYSFDWGNAHFVALDSERIGRDQVAWLEADLAATSQPWKIVFAHHPPFSSGAHGSDIDFRRHFMPVIQRHGVALVLSGHDHHYERSKPQDGTTYIVTGGGGHGTREVGRSDFTQFSVETLHFVQVEVNESEIFVHAIDGTGVEFDSARIRLGE
jgi:acid phosphatase type 7